MSKCPLSRQRELIGYPRKLFPAHFLGLLARKPVVQASWVGSGKSEEHSRQTCWVWVLHMHLHRETHWASPVWQSSDSPDLTQGSWSQAASRATTSTQSFVENQEVLVPAESQPLSIKWQAPTPHPNTHLAKSQEQLSKGLYSEPWHQAKCFAHIDSKGDEAHVCPVSRVQNVTWTFFT